MFMKELEPEPKENFRLRNTDLNEPNSYSNKLSSLDLWTPVKFW